MEALTVDFADAPQKISLGCGRRGKPALFSLFPFVDFVVLTIPARMVTYLFFFWMFPPSPGGTPQGHDLGYSR